MSTDLGRRFIFNFTARCNMTCPYCYIPFDGDRVEKKTVLAVFDRMKELKPHSVTIGGGDPFQYVFLPKLIENLGTTDCVVQVDTNAKGLRHAHLELLKSKVRLLGLPLDGADARVHGEMRDDPHHYEQVLKWLKKCCNYGIKVRVNTVVSRKNVSELPAIGEIVQQYNLDRWSLYQYWPIGDGIANRHEFEISDNQYRKAIDEIRQRFPAVPLGGGTVEDRWRGYFFVTPVGGVYTVNPDDPSRYSDVGSIFAEQIIDQWRAISVR